MKDNYNNIIRILRKDFNKKISTDILPLSARALFTIDMEDVQNYIIKNYHKFNTINRQQITKLFRNPKSKKHSKKILSFIRKENKSQLRMMLPASFEYFKDPSVTEDLIKLFWTEKTGLARRTMFNAIAFQLKDTGIQFYLEVLAKDNNNDVLYNVFQTLCCYGRKKDKRACTNWLKYKSQFYDDFTINGALIVLVNIDNSYRNIFGKLKFKILLKKLNLKSLDSSGRERYELCIYYSQPFYRTPFFHNYNSEMDKIAINIFPVKFIAQINKIVESGLLQNILDNGLNKEKNREKFLKLIEFSHAVNNAIGHLSSSNSLKLLLPEKYSEYLDIDIYEQLNNLVELPENEFICEDCKRMYTDPWVPKLQNEFIVFPFVSLSSRLCKNHMYRELNEIATNVILDRFLVLNYPVKRKIDILKGLVYSEYEIDEKPQTIWSNSLGQCKCGESRYPLSINNLCPICHIRSNRNSGKNNMLINQLNKVDRNNTYNDNFFFYLNYLYDGINFLKNKNGNDIYSDNEYKMKQYLFSEEQTILNWPIAEYLYQLALGYDEVQWKSEEEAIKLVSKILDDNDYIKYKKWPWLVSDISGSQMHVDGFFPKSNIAVEFQGKQHFQPVDYFGGKQAYELQKRRDTVKKDLLRKHNIFLIEVEENELDEQKISKKLKEVG